MNISDEIKAVIGIWSEFFTNRINDSAKFKINKNMVYVYKKDDRIWFYISYKDRTSMNASCTQESLFSTCRHLRKMLEAE